MNTNPEAILITGASARIGLELAKESLRMGFHVVLHYRSSPEPARTYFKDETRVHFLYAELKDYPEQLVEQANDLPLRLKGLVNNASIFTQGNLSDTDHFQQILNINVMIPVKLCARFVQFSNRGWIVNITDAHVNRFSSRYQNYRISKKLLTELTTQQASLFAPDFRVNAIAPGAILRAESESEEEFGSLAERIPLRRTGNVKSIRQAYRFLVENEYVTGTVIPVDGGWHLD
ncbi:MAG: SDR family oxidoreductase [Chitinispirillaceae bacterium]